MKMTVVTKNVIGAEGSARKAFADVTFGDSFVINNIVVSEGKNGLFLSMPSYKSSGVDEYGKPLYYPHCNPITKEFHQELTEFILKSYKDGVAYVKNENDLTLPYEVEVMPVVTSGGKKACVRIYFDKKFVVHASVMEGRDGKIFVSMPSYSERKADGAKKYYDVAHPITADFRKVLYDEILAIYRAGGNAQRREAQPQDASRTQEKPKITPVSSSSRMAASSQGVATNTTAKSSGFVSVGEAEALPYM